MEFIEIYNKIEKSKKLAFLKELLLKDSDLQQQFLQYTSAKKANLDDITAINIEEIRDKIWQEISEIDVDSHIECGYHEYYSDDGAVGEELLDAIFSPYEERVHEFVRKGDTLNAFRIILAIYELILIEAPEVYDDNYFVFGEEIESYIETACLSAIGNFKSTLENRVLSEEVVHLMITLLFSEIQKYQNLSDDEEANYNIYHFQYLLEGIIEKPKNTKYLLEILEKHPMYNQEYIILHCASILEDNELFLKTANTSFMYNKEIALKLQKKYKELNQQSELARISKILLKQERSSDYAIFVIENIDKTVYEDLYINALKIYIKEKHSIEHYKMLREYLSENDRLNFVNTMQAIYEKVFYVKLLEIEKQYELILNFAKKNSDDYELDELVKPIVSVYPDEVFEIIKIEADKQIAYRGRSSYARAASLLQLMLNVSQIKDIFKSYISELYNHQPRLPALRDELTKAGLL